MAHADASIPCTDDLVQGLAGGHDGTSTGLRSSPGACHVHVHKHVRSHCTWAACTLHAHCMAHAHRMHTACTLHTLHTLHQALAAAAREHASGRSLAAALREAEEHEVLPLSTPPLRFPLSTSP